MAQPVEIFGSVKGMARDFGIDSLPPGFLWDLVDALPNRKGARVEQRGNWNYFPQASAVDYGGIVYGGAHVRFLKGTKLLVNANNRICEAILSDGARYDLAPGHLSMVQNGVLLRDRLYFFDGTGNNSPAVITFDGVSSPSVSYVLSAPKAKVGIAYKERLVVGGVQTGGNPANVYFSPLETEGTSPNFGPLGTWDAASFIGTTQEVTGLAGQASQILVFHPGMIERIRGSEIDTTAGGDGDMYVETLTDQVGCSMPHTIVPWRENVIFADEHGVFLTDGATVRNLIELGGMGDFWRAIYGSRLTGTSIVCGVFLDYLLVTVLVDTGIDPTGSFTLVCDLNERTWMRFTNTPVTCYIPSTSDQEESYCGHYVSHRLLKTSTMFQDPLPIPTPPPDYVDGDGRSVLMSLTTGFKRLAKEEGMQRLRGAYVSYHSASEQRAAEPNAVKVEYATSPPIPEGFAVASGNWQQAGYLPDGNLYQRKKLPIGKRGYGIMVRLSAARATRTTRFFSVGIERTSQDRAKVTT